jgi:hypothetical protein
LTLVGLLQQLLTPAIVSLLVTLWISRILEARRARRDHITKLFEVARDDVRRGVEAGVDYFAVEPSMRTAFQEAKVIGAESEIRSAVSLLIKKMRSPGCEEANASAHSAFETLLATLTGGNFQSTTGEISKSHLVQLVHAGAEMRTALARLRDTELRDRADRDPIGKRIAAAWAYLVDVPGGKI